MTAGVPEEPAGPISYKDNKIWEFYYLCPELY